MITPWERYSKRTKELDILEDEYKKKIAKLRESATVTLDNDRKFCQHEDSGSMFYRICKLCLSEY